MKTLVYFLCAGIILTSCTKTDIAPVKNSVSSANEDDASILKVRSALLTAHPWMYQGFYFHYVDNNNKGDVQYERGSTHNIIDLDATRYFFRSNGTFVEFDGGYRYPGTWHFTDRTATVLVLNYNFWTNDCTIITFTNNHLTYTEPMGYGAKSFTELIPAR